MEFVIDGHNLKILFKFTIAEKEYIAYIDENNEIGASRMIIEGEDTRLEEIVDDQEWDLVEKEIDKRLN